MEGNFTDQNGNHFPEDPRSPHNDNTGFKNKRDIKLSDVVLVVLVSGITFFNFALFVFIAIKKFT